jgi:hypothetical protein
MATHVLDRSGRDVEQQAAWKGGARSGAIITQETFLNI